MEGARLRAAAAKLRARYARWFRVPIETVEIVYFRDEKLRDDASVQSPGNPEWTVGQE